MQRVKLHLAYDGTDYSGWQIQKNTDATIQQKLEEVIGKYDSSLKRVHGACRTDAGVHAREQVAHFDMSEDIPEERIPLALNGDLPRDIICRGAEMVSDEFHSRFDARGKIYRYRLATGDYPRIFSHRYTHFMKDCLQVSAMKRAVKYLIGKKDFSSFRARGCSSTSPVRKIFDARVERREQKEVHIDIAGSGFLYNMVRIIAGTLIEIGRERMSPGEMENIINARDRSRAGFTAPACGLTLVRVFYEEEFCETL